jgi:ureidoacrylate peracid hydrolase
MSSQALIVVDMQNGFCHPDGSLPRLGFTLAGVADAVAATAQAVADASSTAAGSWDGAIVDELGCTDADLVVDKVRFDAFQWTSLDPLVQGLGVTELVICGVVTNICVESTVRSAFMRDHPVTLLADCCAARTTRLHDIGVEVMGECGFATISGVGAGFRFVGAVAA